MQYFRTVEGEIHAFAFWDLPKPTFPALNDSSARSGQ
jgi:hypothetical protein